MKRVFLIVLDSFGVGEMPDAADFGDKGANTLRSCFETETLNVPVLRERSCALPRSPRAKTPRRGIGK